jgi:hypothetical protein
MNVLTRKRSKRPKRSKRSKRSKKLRFGNPAELKPIVNSRNTHIDKTRLQTILNLQRLSNDKAAAKAKMIADAKAAIPKIYYDKQYIKDIYKSNMKIVRELLYNTFYNIAGVFQYGFIVKYFRSAKTNPNSYLNKCNSYTIDVDVLNIQETSDPLGIDISEDIYRLILNFYYDIKKIYAVECGYLSCTSSFVISKKNKVIEYMNEFDKLAYKKIGKAMLDTNVDEKFNINFINVFNMLIKDGVKNTVNYHYNYWKRNVEFHWVDRTCISGKKKYKKNGASYIPLTCEKNKELDYARSGYNLTDDQKKTRDKNIQKNYEDCTNNQINKYNFINTISTCNYDNPRLLYKTTMKDKIPLFFDMYKDIYQLTYKNEDINNLLSYIYNSDYYKSIIDCILTGYKTQLKDKKTELEKAEKAAGI